MSVAFLSDGPSDRRALTPQNATFGQTLRDAFFNHLADRSELLADGLRLTDQRLQNDVGFTLLIAEISANDLFRRLELTIDTAIALLQSGGVPRQVEMNQIGAIALEVDAFAGRISADQNAQRLNIGIRVERSFHLFPSIRSRCAGEDANSVISAIRVRHRLAQASFEPSPRVLVFCENDETPAIPVLAAEKVGFDPVGQPAHPGVGS